VLNPDFALATQAAPTVEVLPGRVAHASQPESLNLLKRDAFRFGFQANDLLRLRSASQNVTLQVNRATATYLGTLPNGALSIEFPAGSGEEGRTTKTTRHTATHESSGIKATWATRDVRGLNFGLYVADTRADIVGETTAMRQFLALKDARPFEIPSTNRQAMATVGRDDADGGGTLRLGWRSLAVPTTLYGSTNAMELNFRGQGPVWEARRWWHDGDRSSGVLLGGQAATGDGGTYYNAARQGDTRAGFHSLAAAYAYRRPHGGGGELTAQLTYQRAHITGDASFAYPTGNDFADFLGGTGIANTWADVRATSIHVGIERPRGSMVYRAGYQGVLFDAEAGFDYHTQYLGGGVRNTSSEVMRLHNASLHILGGGVERRYAWGKVGYGLLLTIPLGIDLNKTDLIDHPDARTAPTSIEASVRGGMAHTLFVEMAL
jgi:hypothetical protein